MLTTIAVCVWAMSLKVVAVRFPVIGLLFTVGVGTVCADEAGAKLKREAITMPSAINAAAIKAPVNSVVLGVDILVLQLGESPPPFHCNLAGVPNGEI